MISVSIETEVAKLREKYAGIDSAAVQAQYEHHVAEVNRDPTCDPETHIAANLFATHITLANLSQDPTGLQKKVDIFNQFADPAHIVQVVEGQYGFAVQFCQTEKLYEVDVRGDWNNPV